MIGMAGRMAQDFTGKRILVTGASRGLGHVAALAFARAGARVLVAGRTREPLETLRASMPDPDRHEIYVGDLIEPGRTDELASLARQTLSGIDVVLHALGGGYGFRDPLLSRQQFVTLHEVNLGIGAELNRLLVPDMIAAGSGHIVHVGSIASGEAVGSVGYNTVKAALAAYVRSLGRELAGKGVVVTAVLPGAFFGPENAFRRLETRSPEVVRDFVDRRLPRGKVGEADEIVPLIMLLAGPAASMMAGSCVPIDAGEGFAYPQL
ncbi:MAG: SDR family oxidoreductase [Alphaproteobacteria bacterium]|nr:SDR family oxidoreductase [Alphaproteobacteria bacterium]